MPENTTHSAADFTPYLDKIKLPSGNEYWFQDTWAQERLDSLGDIVVGGDGVHFKGETTSQLTDEITTNPIVIGGQNYTPATGDLVIYAKREFVWSGSKWLELGDLSSFGALATKDAAAGSINVPTVTGATFSGNEGPIAISAVSNTGGNYQPSGSVSKPNFTGTAATINVSGVPSGSVSKPNFTGTTATVNVSGTPNGSVSAPTISVKTAGTTTTVNSITSVGSLPSLTMLLDGTDSHMLVVSWDAGTLPSKGSNVTVKTGDAAYQASTPTFTGSATTFSGSYQPAGSVSKPDFTGSTSTFNGSYTPSGSVGQPTFTGTTVQISGTTTPSGTINIGTGTSNINVTVS